MVKYLIYDKKAKGKPVVAVTEAEEKAETKDVIKLEIPKATPAKFGAVAVDENILAEIFIPEYKDTDKDGRVKLDWERYERIKHLPTVFDETVDSNLILFGDYVEEIIQIMDLNGQEIESEIINKELGIINVSTKTGILKATCIIRTGNTYYQPPELVKNFTWKKNRRGEITGVKLKKKVKTKTIEFLPPPEEVDVDTKIKSGSTKGRKAPSRGKKTKAKGKGRKSPAKKKKGR